MKEQKYKTLIKYSDEYIKSIMVQYDSMTDQIKSLKESREKLFEIYNIPKISFLYRRSRIEKGITTGEHGAMKRFEKEQIEKAKRVMN